MDNHDMLHQLYVDNGINLVRVGAPRPLPEALRLKAAHGKIRTGAKTLLLPI